MKELYEKSIVILKEYHNKPSVKEWNGVAKEYGLMSAKTMCFMSGLNWSQLCDKVRRK